MTLRLETFLLAGALLFTVLAASKCVEEGYQDSRTKEYIPGKPRPREVK